MNIVDKRAEREQERNEKEKLKREAEKKRVEVLYPDVPEIKLVPDWRVTQEYEWAIEPNRKYFVHERLPAKKRFLEEAVKNRHQLRKLIVEDYEFNYEYASVHSFSIETDADTLDILTMEARKLNLSLEAYIRAIFYTAAFEINKAKRNYEEDVKKQLEENACVNICDEGRGRQIGPELRRKLEEKFGKPRCNGMAYTYNYVDMLLDVAAEYFSL